MIKETQEYFRLRDETERMRKEAITKLLAEQKDCMVQLRQLGYEGAANAELPVEQKKKRVYTGKKREDSYCKLCEINGHDARSHKKRAQGRAFTQKELKELNLPGSRDTTEELGKKHKKDEKVIPWRALKRVKA